MFNIRPMEGYDRDLLVPLVAHFRVTMSRFQGRAEPTDFSAADKELHSYLEPEYRIFIAENEDDIPIAYLVCHIEEGKIWLESMFVLPDYRRQGVGSALFIRAEQLAEELGFESLHNCVHPNNERMIAFLRKQNYQVLNMIEIRKAKSEESGLPRMKVGLNSFQYCC